MLTLEELKIKLDYDPNIGDFWWRSNGERAGGLTGRGYRKIRINGKKYFEHRLAWLFVKEVWPEDQIDHINGVRDDNRIVNLRDVNRTQNRHNSSSQKGKKDKYKGVYWENEEKRWRVHLTVGGKQISLGRYINEDLAALVYNHYATKHRGVYAKLNIVEDSEWLRNHAMAELGARLALRHS